MIKIFFQLSNSVGMFQKFLSPFLIGKGFVKSYIIDNWKEIVGEEYYKNFNS